MANNNTHITENKVIVRVLFALLALTTLTISLSQFSLAAISVAIVLIISGVKAFLILSYYMHLKHEKILLRILVAMIFILFAVIVLITFIDYAYR